MPLNQHRNEQVDDYISQFPDWQQELLNRLREIILETDAGISEAIKWQVPFYAKRKNLCYLNARKKDVQLGFYRGSIMDQSDGLLEGEGSMVRHMTFFEGEEIPTEPIREKIIEALALDDIA